jgi:hypothetical protein
LAKYQGMESMLTPWAKPLMPLAKNKSDNDFRFSCMASKLMFAFDYILKIVIIIVYLNKING